MSTATDTQPAPSTLVRLLLAWLLPALVVFITVTPVGSPIFDPDLWWHLAVGQWVVEHRAVPDFDPFSQIGPTMSWVAYSWLYEVALFGLYSAFGLAGVIAYRVVVSLLIVRAIHALVTRLEKRFVVAVGLTATSILAMNSLFSERPWLITLLFSAITLHAIAVLRQPGQPRLPPWIWTLPLLYVVWANVHIQFVYGLFLLLLACLAPWIDFKRGWTQPVDTGAWPHSRRYRHLVLLALLCFLATFLNPYGVRLYGVILEYASQPGPFRWVNELKALEFREPGDWVVLALTAGACFVLGGRMTTAFSPLLLISTAIFAFRARRDLWFVVLADLFILASAGPTPVPLREQFAPTAAGRAAILTGLALLIAVTARVRGLGPERLQKTVERHFPAAAARHVADKGYPGPLFNDFNFGGYLIWALPGLPVALDGRTNLHGDERIERYAQVFNGLPGWQYDKDLNRAGIVFAGANEPLVSLLRLDHKRFREVYADDLAVVFVRVLPTPKE